MVNKDLVASSLTIFILYEPLGHNNSAKNNLQFAELKLFNPQKILNHQALLLQVFKDILNVVTNFQGSTMSR